MYEKQINIYLYVGDVQVFTGLDCTQNKLRGCVKAEHLWKGKEIRAQSVVFCDWLFRKRFKGCTNADLLKLFFTLASDETVCLWVADITASRLFRFAQQAANKSQVGCDVRLHCFFVPDTMLSRTWCQSRALWKASSDSDFLPHHQTVSDLNQSFDSFRL